MYPSTVQETTEITETLLSEGCMCCTISLLHPQGMSSSQWIMPLRQTLAQGQPWDRAGIRASQSLSCLLPGECALHSGLQGAMLPCRGSSRLSGRAEMGMGSVQQPLEQWKSPCSEMEKAKLQHNQCEMGRVRSAQPELRTQGGQSCAQPLTWGRHALP